MAITSSGKIDLSALQTEFGGANPVNLSEYYNVAGSPVPTSGLISLSNFYSKAAYSRTLTDVRTGSSVNTANIPSTVRRIGVIVVGGGGSGSAGGNGSSGKTFFSYGGAGGGSGGFAYYQFEIPDAYLGGYFTYTVGAGGAAVTNGPSFVFGKTTYYSPVNGNSGGTTTVIYKSAGGTTVATFNATGGGGGGYVDSGLNILNNTTRGTAGSYSNTLVFGTILASTVYSGGLGGGVYDWSGGTGGGSSYQKYLNSALNIDGSSASGCGGTTGANGGGNGVGRAGCDGTTTAGSGNTADNFAGSGGGGVGDGALNRTSGAGAAGRVLIYY